MKQYAETSDKRYAKDIIGGTPIQGKAWLDFDEKVHKLVCYLYVHFDLD